eukprot:TRINITY_DN2836_c0_g1_i4.p1 TRINITY_DN2836_c0_g1~~TRINITY_DN2836_c0_g1_i4.p1  ORF type:complete len:460 (-),score=62.00 TRINITY_DN2836_c0_g1_i4:80-1459(-)
MKKQNVIQLNFLFSVIDLCQQQNKWERPCNIPLVPLILKQVYNYCKKQINVNNLERYQNIVFVFIYNLKYLKERLDFSCAIFGPDGSLIANAPHLPVHLGSMQEAVKYQIETLKENWKDGEVIITNHPAAGGAHLPDVTIITPVWESGKPIFYLASRGHHADIGGLTPGSMPPFSKSIYDEGIAIKSFKLVSNGIFKEKEITDILTKPGPGRIGTRMLSDNISDIKAQVAANNKGQRLIQDLISEYGLKTVHSYMNFIQDNAEESVRRMLVEISLKNKMKEIDFVQEEDYMDDGSKIQLKLIIDRINRTAIFDFTGSGYQVLANTNCPKAVTMSAILYCLRCLVNTDIPLNYGCMKPIKCIIPKNSILNPSDDAPIVGGNVLTSQRITDVILKAFRACAASQGCMNNLTFGNNKFGYYETIACLLYTSDAADDMQCVDLGGRRIIKKKKKTIDTYYKMK